MSTKRKEITAIHNSLSNGQRRQMVEMIDEYPPMNFWKGYKDYLAEYYDRDKAYTYFSDACISYFLIKGR